MATIAVGGASGLIGTALVRHLRDRGDTVLRLVRGAAVQPDEVGWNPAKDEIHLEPCAEVDTLVNLSGAPISHRWTAWRKRQILLSRVRCTRTLARAATELGPHVALVSASAVGYYGDRGDEVLTEGSTPGDDFLADVCLAWEAATASVEAAGIRTVHLRTGIVLDAGGGALAKQLPAFKLGLGAKAGTGRQWMSWITLHDEVRAIRFALEHDTVTGPVNLTAPAPVTNADFTDAVGEALHRPTFLTIPRFARKAPFAAPFSWLPRRSRSCDSPAAPRARR